MTAPEPETTDTIIADFAARLRRLREGAGNPSFRAMASRTDCSHTSLNQATKGKIFPTERTVQAFFQACDAPVKPWTQMYERYKRRVDLSRGGPEVPATVPPPRPEDLHSVAQFAESLKRLKDASGLSFKTISEQSVRHTKGTRYNNGSVPRQTLSDFVGMTDHMGHPDVLGIFLKVLEVPPTDILRWRAAYTRAKELRDQPAGEAPTPDGTNRSGEFERSMRSKSVWPTHLAMMGSSVLAALVALTWLILAILDLV